jgi:hypothetical protein
MGLRAVERVNREGERMRSKTGTNSRRGKGRAASKMPKIEFNMRAIREIKKRRRDTL